MARREDRPKTAPHVLAARDISAGTIISGSDLRVVGDVRSAADVTAVLAGRRATITIPSRSLIRPGMLGDKTPPGRILTLPVRYVPLLGDRGLPFDVELAFSSRQAAPSGAVFKVTLLSVSPAPNQSNITVRLPEKDLLEMAKWLGSADIAVVFPVREPSVFVTRAEGGLVCPGCGLVNQGTSVNCSCGFPLHVLSPSVERLLRVKE